MRILLVQETDWINKGPFQQNHLMERLAKKHHQIRVIDHEILWHKQKRREVFSKRQVFNHVSRIYQDAEVTVIRPGIIKIPTLDYVSLLFSRRREIGRQINEFRPDVILGFHILSAYLGMQVAKKNNIPFIYYWVDVYHTQLSFKLYQWIGRRIEKKTLQNADKVLVINEKLKDYVIKMGSKPTKTCVVRGSVDLDRFNPSIDVTEVKKRYQIKDSDIVLCFVGMFHKDLGLKEAIVELSRAKNPNLKLLLVGGGDQSAPEENEELQNLAEELGISGQVILTGRRPYQEIPALINVANICLLPAKYTEMMQDIVPIKMYEYMAMKKPVISTKLPGVMKEFGEDNGVIYVDKPEDVVAKAIELVQNNSVEILGSKARSFVEKYSWDSITDEFEKILEEAVESSKLKRSTF